MAMGGIAAAAAQAALKKKKREKWANFEDGLDESLKIQRSTDSDVSYDTAVTTSLSPSAMAGIVAAAKAQSARRREGTQNINDSNDLHKYSMPESENVASSEKLLEKKSELDLEVQGSVDSGISYDDPMKPKAISTSSKHKIVTSISTLDPKSQIAGLGSKSEDSIDLIISPAAPNENEDSDKCRPSNPVAATIESRDETTQDFVLPPVKPIAKYDSTASVESAPSDEQEEELISLKESESLDSGLSYGETVITVNTQPKSGRKTFNSSVLRPIVPQTAEKKSKKRNKKSNLDPHLKIINDDATESNNKGEIANLAAEAAKKRLQSKPEQPRPVNPSIIGGIAAEAARAALKRSQQQQLQDVN